MATAYERVRIARGAKRPTGIDYLQNVFHGFFELHGDRRYADDPAIVGGLAYLGAVVTEILCFISPLIGRTLHLTMIITS